MKPKSANPKPPATAALSRAQPRPVDTMRTARLFVTASTAVAIVLALGGPAVGAPEPSAMSASRAAGVHFNIRDFGAVGDGKVLDSAAINKAIEACAVAGGGQVLFPPGD